MFILPLIVFIIALFLIITRPKGISIGYVAIGGALIVLFFGFASIQNLVEVIHLVWNATLAFVALVIICFALDKIGIFEWAALHMILLSKGSSQRLFIYLILLGAIVSAFFANDGAALILTPLILAKMRLLKIPESKITPFVMAGGFIADTASLPLVTSNLVNIIAANYFDISYGTFAKYMIVPNLFSVGISLILLFIYYRKFFPFTCNYKVLKAPHTAVKNRFLFQISLCIVFFMFLLCFLGGYYSIPVSLILMPAAIILALLVWSKNLSTPLEIYKATPFSIIFFSIGMYLIVFSLKSVGLFTALSTLIHQFLKCGLFPSTLLMGLLSGVLSCIVNNLPGVMVNSIAISHLSLDKLTETLLALANIIGADLGPKMFPIGSLATLLWLHLLEKQKIHIKWGYFIKTGLILTLPTLLITLAALYFWVIWIGV